MSDTETDTIQSSPPPPPPDPKDNDQNIAKKRSYEDVSKDENEGPQSSVTLRGDVETMSGVSPTHPSSTRPQQDVASQQMPPPKRPDSEDKRSSQRPPQSGQRSQATQQSQTDSTQVMSSFNIESQNGEPAKEAHSKDENTSHADQAESSSSSPVADPQADLEAFDWIDLQRRYHDKIHELQAKEDGIVEEFENLCTYFELWAQAGSQREVDRSFKRMKTQITLVQNHEDQLEQKRQHYIQVVNAFKSALDLLAR